MGRASNYSSQDEAAQIFYMSFGDLMVILCCFFVIIHSMSQVDRGSFERIRTEFTGNSAGSLVSLEKELQEIAVNIPKVNITYDKDGVRINMDSAALFESGSAVLKDGALDDLEQILLHVRETQYTVDIEGHTDDLNFYRQTEEGLIETNWSLSGARASTVVLHLLGLGFAEGRVRIIGYAANRPKVKNQKADRSKLTEGQS